MARDAGASPGRQVGVSNDQSGGGSPRRISAALGAQRRTVLRASKVTREAQSPPRNGDRGWFDPIRDHDPGHPRPGNSKEIDMSMTECSCKKRDCYSCRRQEIDQIAERIHAREVRICTGMKGFSVEQHAWQMAQDYRCKKINELAMELSN